MAEAMCGPANPLQQFKQQTTLDRSLQQDRLRSRQDAGRGFRSMDPSAGLVDPEFEAFQAGMDMNQIPSLQQPGNWNGTPQASSWASDFQRLNISSPPPFQQQQQQQQQQHHHLLPLVAAPTATSWAQSFHEQRAEVAPRTQTASPSPQAFQQRARYGLTGFQSTFTPPAFAPSTQIAKGKAPITEQFDEAAFERAFDLAREDMIAEAEQESQVADAVADAINTEKSEQPWIAETSVDEEWKIRQMLHGGDIEYQAASETREGEKEVQKPQADDDVLAATAQELLEKIEHNQTEKFKNSQFLGLMRKLRDREVRVEGDKMVETANATSVSTTDLADATLNATSSNPLASSFGPGEQFFTSPHVPATGATQLARPQSRIPPGEQDYDSGRTIDPRDGQAVVDLLDQRGALTDDMAYDPSFAESTFHSDSPGRA